MPVVAQLDDDGRDRVAGVVVGAGDPERLAEGRAGGPRADERSGLSRRPRQASTARSISAQSGPPPKRTGSSTGRPVSAATRAISARASSSDAIAEVFSAIATTFDGATRPATFSWRSMNGPSVGDRERRVGQVVEVVLGLAGLVDEDHRLGRRAVDQRERHRRVRRVVERALALDDHPVAAPLALLDHPLDRALGEVADEAVDRGAPAVDHHPGLAGRDERRPIGRPPGPPTRSSRATDILPIAQSVPTVRITRLPGPWRRPTAVSIRSGGRR